MMETSQRVNVHEWVFNHLPLGDVAKQALLDTLREERKTQGMCLGTPQCPGNKHGCRTAATFAEFKELGADEYVVCGGRSVKDQTMHVPQQVYKDGKNPTKWQLDDENEGELTIVESMKPEDFISSDQLALIDAQQKVHCCDSTIESPVETP
jgi:hypothetical protein